MSPKTDALDVLHALVLADGRRWGEVATDWQRADATAVLDPAAGPFLHYCSRPKGGSKSTDLAGMCIAWLLTQAPPMAEGFAVAADKEQANRLLDRAREFIARTPELRGRVEVQASRIVGPDGTRVQALAADVAGSEGLLTPWIVVDELANWPTTDSARRMWTSVISGVPKWPGMRLTVISHAGAPSHWSHKVFEQAGSSERWRRSVVPGPLPWVTEADLEEQRALLTPSQFARRHMNVWAEGEDRLTNPDDVRRCVGHVGALAPGPGVTYALGLDIGLRNDATVLTCCHLERGDDRSVVVVDHQQVWRGSRESPVVLADVEAAVFEVSRAYNNAPVVFDPWQAASMTQRLRDRGVKTTEFVFSQSSIGRLALTMYNLLRDGLLDLPDDDGLVDELAEVRLIETRPGVFRIDHDEGDHDDRVISLALAAHHVLTAGPVARRRGVVVRDEAGEVFDSPVGPGDAPGRVVAAARARAGHDVFGIPGDVAL